MDRKQPLRALCFVACVCLLQACTSIKPDVPFLQRSYALNVESTVTPGESIFTVRSGAYKEASLWVGAFYGGQVTDKWEQDIEEHELLFEGFDGNTLKCTYRKSEVPAVALELPSGSNPSIRSPFYAVSTGSVNNSLRPMFIETSGPGHKLTHAGVELELISWTARELRYRVLGDSFVEPEPVVEAKP